eukprot:gene4759-733_t
MPLMPRQLTVGSSADGAPPPVSPVLPTSPLTDSGHRQHPNQRDWGEQEHSSQGHSSQLPKPPQPPLRLLRTFRGTFETPHPPVPVL